MWNRRDFFRASAAAAACAALPGRARAASAADTNFLFVFAQGGWDPTRVLATPFSNRNVAMEAAADRATAGGITYVSHPDRPSVDSFFSAYHDRSVVMNGLMVRSIAHEICTMIAMTGTTGGTTADWPAIIASRDAGRYVLPHVVLGGPSFPGDLGAQVSRTGGSGQLEALISGQSRDWSDLPGGGPSRPAEQILDRYLARRAAARATWGKGRDARLTADFSAAVDHMRQLKDLQYVMDFTGGADLASQAEVACDALELGITRCLTLSASSGALGWDTHANNDADQSLLWEDLFYGLNQLLLRLDSTVAPGGGTLADSTVVVVLSEMGRTPNLNSFNGKDHWPYTSALLIGPGLSADRVIGDFDAGYYGKAVDPATAEVVEEGPVLSAESLGATLLAMADIDPAEYVSGVQPLEGILS
jgi:Protein of unknown function (DUF1501)